jgi:hypothetical protein
MDDTAASSPLKWEIVPELDYPCADISFSYTPPDKIEVLMRFSCVKGLAPKDLRLIFDGAVTFAWESEYSCSIPLPKPLPKCASEKWNRWTFPLLEIRNSAWRQNFYNAMPPAAEGRSHYVLVSMNDVVHILSTANIHATWVDAVF